MGNTTRTLFSLLLLAGCGELAVQRPPPPCAVTDDASLLAPGDSFVVYVIDDVAGGLTCVPGIEDIDGETCADIFLGCIATVEGPVDETTTFTVGIENRSEVGAIDLEGVAFTAGSDPSWTIVGELAGTVEPGTSQELTMAFTPVVDGAVSGGLTIRTNASNDDDDGNVIQLRGTAIVP